MNVSVKANRIHGEVEVIPSKSAAHRSLICAALADGPTEIVCPASSLDIEATVRCLASLGADIREEAGVYLVTPIKRTDRAQAFCGESGSTLRFLIPVAAALGGEVTFTGEGRLPSRPCAPLVDALIKNGAEIEYSGLLPLTTRGGLRSGRFAIAGNISSQFISGLIFALPLLSGDSELEITGKIESRPYIEMTLSAVREFGITAEFDGNKIKIPGGQKYRSPKKITIEGDWSNAAFWAVLGAFSDEGVTLRGVNHKSLQGDRAVADILERFGAQVERGEGSLTVRRGKLRGLHINAAEIPDLVPVLSALASVANSETRISGAARLALKESDRLKTTSAMIEALGGEIYAEKDGLRIFGKKQLSGGTVDSCNDHRIAMSAAVASAACEGEVIIKNAEAVRKSYGDFFERLKDLGVSVNVLDNR